MPNGICATCGDSHTRMNEGIEILSAFCSEDCETQGLEYADEVSPAYPDLEYEEVIAPIEHSSSISYAAERDQFEHEVNSKLINIVWDAVPF